LVKPEVPQRKPGYTRQMELLEKLLNTDIEVLITYLRGCDAAELLGVHPSTISRWKERLAKVNAETGGEAVGGS